MADPAKRPPTKPRKADRPGLVRAVSLVLQVRTRHEALGPEWNALTAAVERIADEIDAIDRERNRR